MSELEELWAECHDAERRLGVIERQLAAMTAQRQDETAAAAAGLSRRQWVIATVIGAVSTAALVLSLLSQLA